MWPVMVVMVGLIMAVNTAGVAGQGPSVEAVQARAMLEQILATIPGVDQASIDAVGAAGCPEGAAGGRCALCLCLCVCLSVAG